jgi:hypothetical protein
MGPPVPISALNLPKVALKGEPVVPKRLLKWTVPRLAREEGLPQGIEEDGLYES